MTTGPDPRPLWPKIQRWPGQVGVALLILAVRCYQWTLSPLLSRLGPVCRFEPSCSCYMIEALRKYGLVKGLAKGVARVLRCHPWGPSGYDPP